MTCIGGFVLLVFNSLIQCTNCSDSMLIVLSVMYSTAFADLVYIKDFP